jgi:hypothetical protein
LNFLSGKNGHVPPLFEIVGAHIVQAYNMVIVLVGHHNGIEVLDTCSQHLLPEIGATINGYRSIAQAQVSSSTQPFITGIRGLAHFTITA